MLNDAIGPIGHLAWSAVWIGAARAAFRLAVPSIGRHAGRRQPIEQAAREAQLGQARLSLELAASLCQSFAAHLDREREAETGGTPEAIVRSNLVKVGVAEHVFDAVDRLIDVTGMSGFVRKDHNDSQPLAGLERLWRDLRTARLTTRNEPLLRSAGRFSLIDRKLSLGWPDHGFDDAIECTLHEKALRL